MTDSQPLSPLIAAQVQSIREQLRTRMDGMVSASMREHGLHYTYNWGWTIGYIKELAREYTPSEELAAALRNSPVRELQILSILLCPIEALEQEATRASYLSLSARSQELLELIAFQLLSRSECGGAWAEDYLVSWTKHITESDHRYLALLTLAHRIKRGVGLSSDVTQLLRQILDLYLDLSASLLLRRTTWQILVECLDQESPYRPLLESLLLQSIEDPRLSADHREALESLAAL